MKRANGNSKRVHRLLAAVKQSRTPDGRVHLALTDGTVASGRLVGCTATTVFLIHQRPIPAELLAQS